MNISVAIEASSWEVGLKRGDFGSGFELGELKLCITIEVNSEDVGLKFGGLGSDICGFDKDVAFCDFVKTLGERHGASKLLIAVLIKLKGCGLIIFLAGFAAWLRSTGDAL